MRLKALVVAALVAAGAALVPQVASADALPGAKAAQSPIVANGLLQEVRRRHRHWHRHHWHHHRFNRCSRIRRGCAYRFGWGTWRFRQCTYHYGC